MEDTKIQRIDTSQEHCLLSVCQAAETISPSDGGIVPNDDPIIR